MIGRAATGSAAPGTGGCRRKARRPLQAAVLLAMAVLLVVVGVGGTGVAGAQAQDPGDITGDEAQELADRYAPIIMLKAQEEECDSHGESYIPMTVDKVLGNSQIALRQVGSTDAVVMWGPTARDLYGLGEGFYLDFPGHSLQPGCLYERDSRRLNADAVPVVYAHIAVQFDEPGVLALQFWIYWYYNQWNNDHESDWEFIQLLFPASTVSEALGVEPLGVGFAQHEGGERANWNSSKLEREGTHPVVYSSAGSHASYFDSALYLGRSASEGFGCDDTDGPSTRTEVEPILLPDAATGPDDPYAWLDFAGRWGERHDGPFNGPNGPSQKKRWEEPVDWATGLRKNSVVVPAGDGQGDQIVHAFCGVVEFGSNQVIKLQTSPTRIVVTVAIVTSVIVLLVRRTSWESVAPLPIRQRRRAGEIARASFALYRRHPIVFFVTGLMYLPLAALAGAIATVVRYIPFAGDVVSLFDKGGGSSRLLLSVLVGGFATLLAFLIVSGAVATLVEDVSRGVPLSAPVGFARVVARLPDLGRGLLRASVIVVLLHLTVIGIPFGIRQLVRYQMLAQTTMLEQRDGRSALERSTALVRGRWWHTALFVAIIHLILDTAGFAVGLVVLVTFTSLPFWVLSIIVAVVSALVMPLGAIAMTLLYGDMVAEDEERLQRERAQAAEEGENTTGMDSGPEMKLDAR